MDNYGMDTTEVCGRCWRPVTNGVPCYCQSPRRDPDLKPPRADEISNYDRGYRAGYQQATSDLFDKVRDVLAAAPAPEREG